MICRYKIKFISDIEQKIRKLLVNIAVAPFVGVWIEIYLKTTFCYFHLVAPFVGVWIEIRSNGICNKGIMVAPFVGVWIEIYRILFRCILCPSLPSWECGLKYIIRLSTHKNRTVAPFVGVWIEIMMTKAQDKVVLGSLPSWECGLKSVHVAF